MRKSALFKKKLQDQFVYCDSFMLKINMSGPPQSALIKRTQDALGQYVKKPPLTEKLLSKPPFRFLHDVISAVIKSNPGFLDGLYTEEEMNSENVKDREGKIRYLEKVSFKYNRSTSFYLEIHEIFKIDTS